MREPVAAIASSDRSAVSNVRCSTYTSRARRTSQTPTVSNSAL